MQIVVGKKAAKGFPVDADVTGRLWEAYWNGDLRSMIIDGEYQDASLLKALELEESKKDPQKRLSTETHSH